MVGQNRMLLIVQLISRVSGSQMLLISNWHSTKTTIVQTFFQFFYHKKKTVMSGVTLLESTLMYRENFSNYTFDQTYTFHKFWREREGY